MKCLVGWGEWITSGAKALVCAADDDQSMPSLDPALSAAGHRAPVIPVPVEQMAAKPFAIFCLGRDVSAQGASQRGCNAV